RVAAAEAVRSKRRKGPIDVCRDQVWIGADIVGRGDDGDVSRQTGSEMAADRLCARVEPIAALGGARVAGEFRVTRGTPHLRRDAPLRFEHARRFDNLAHDGARTKQANEPVAATGSPSRV